MQFSLMFFSSDAEAAGDRYGLLKSCVEFADANGFSAVWLPERHFHRFGGLFPNPSVVGAALAMVTSNLRIRSGSIVLPLHDPIRVVEEWSVVDNLSNGRVDLSFAQGWNPNDFVLAPESYDDRLRFTLEGIKSIKELWRGGEVYRLNGVGDSRPVRIYPSTRQKELRCWLTCTKELERFVQAGEIGANILTALLFQEKTQVEQKISAYKSAFQEHGHNAAESHVTLMLHTFVGNDLDEVREQIRPPLTNYIEDSVDLWGQGSAKLANLNEKERSRVLALAFERYFVHSSFCGTVETLEATVQQLQSLGIDEIACLVDFGLSDSEVLGSLRLLRQVMDRCIR